MRVSIPLLTGALLQRYPQGLLWDKDLVYFSRQSPVVSCQDAPSHNLLVELAATACGERSRTIKERLSECGGTTPLWIAASRCRTHKQKSVSPKNPSLKRWAFPPPAACDAPPVLFAPLATPDHSTLTGRVGDWAKGSPHAFPLSSFTASRFSRSPIPSSLRPLLFALRPPPGFSSPRLYLKQPFLVL
jgi:hypothetical protein